jgi:hypothetical protein
MGGAENNRKGPTLCFVLYNVGVDYGASVYCRVHHQYRHDFDDIFPWDYDSVRFRYVAGISIVSLHARSGSGAGPKVDIAKQGRGFFVRGQAAFPASGTA